jgi:preprotein translocase subunit SecB
LRKSPLQLVRYFVSEISCVARSDFKPGSEIQFSADQFSVVPEVRAPKNSGGHWTIKLTINQTVALDQNFPYEFKLVILGTFDCGDEMPPGISKETFVEVNGCSILYGVAREMIRATTARGPWADLMVPTISFFNPPADQPAPGASVTS